MARAAKKETPLTIEEKLAKALVPEEEQPYPVPGNWCWVRLPVVCRYIRAGGDKPQVISDVKSERHPIPIVANGLQEDGIIGYTNIQSEQAGTLTVSGRGSIGHAVVRDYPYFPVIRLLVIAPNTATYPEYLKYIFDYFEEKGVGTSIPQLTVPTLKKKIIPLPPLPEQLRIVTLIESLFADLDAAKEKLQAVLDGFAKRRAALLHQAFTGELTREWREEHGVGLESWEECSIADVFDMKAGKNISAKNISPEQNNVFCYPCFGGNGIRGYVKSYNQAGDFPIIGRQGALCGNVHLASGTFYATEHAVVVKFLKDMDVSFAVHYLTFLNLNQYATATAQPGLAVSNILKIPIHYVPIEEQKYIVRILDDVFAKESQSKAAVESVLAKIDTMKKAILATAFRGGFKTNDSSDESAKELLRGVL